VKTPRMPGAGRGEKSGGSGSCSLWVQARPRSGRESIGDWSEDGFLMIRLTSPPTGGRANQECRELLVRALGVSRTRVVLEKGHTARKKKFRIEGLGREQAEARLKAWTRAREA